MCFHDLVWPLFGDLIHGFIRIKLEEYKFETAAEGGIWQMLPGVTGEPQVLNLTDRLMHIAHKIDKRFPIIAAPLWYLAGFMQFTWVSVRSFILGNKVEFWERTRRKVHWIEFEGHETVCSHIQQTRKENKEEYAARTQLTGAHSQKLNNFPVTLTQY